MENKGPLSSYLKLFLLHFITMSRWSDIYWHEIEESGGSALYVADKKKNYTPLINLIQRYTPDIGTVLEAGCGTAVLSAVLSGDGYTVTALDHDPDMLSLARKITAATDTATPVFVQHDLYRLTTLDRKFDTIFSHGTLEHFSDTDIQTLIEQQLAIGTTVIVSVPSDYFRPDDAMYGDERFMSPQQWRSILGGCSTAVIRDELHYFFYSLTEQLAHHLRGASAPYVAFVLQQPEQS